MKKPRRTPASHYTDHEIYDALSAMGKELWGDDAGYGPSVGQWDTFSPADAPSAYNIIRQITGFKPRYSHPPASLWEPVLAAVGLNVPTRGMAINLARQRSKEQTTAIVKLGDASKADEGAGLPVIPIARPIIEWCVHTHTYIRTGAVQHTLMVR